MTKADFWQSDAFFKLKHPAPVKMLLAALDSDPPARYALLFYSAFLHRIYGVMQREGKETQGFLRMQQSFSEAVEQVRAALQTSEGKGFPDARRYTELTQTGMKSLLDLSADLAQVKQWEVENGFVEEGRQPKHKE